jgi:hypothetical protein
MKKYRLHEVGTRPAQVLVCDAASTIHVKRFITFIKLIAPAINILVDAVFATGMFYWYVLVYSTGMYWYILLVCTGIFYCYVLVYSTGMFYWYVLVYSTGMYAI